MWRTIALYESSNNFYMKCVLIDIRNFGVFVGLQYIVYPDPAKSGFKLFFAFCHMLIKK